MASNRLKISVQEDYKGYYFNEYTMVPLSTTETKQKAIKMDLQKMIDRAKEMIDNGTYDDYKKAQRNDQ